MNGLVDTEAGSGDRRRTQGRAPPAQAAWWMLTIPQPQFTPYLPPSCSYIRGQLEQGAGGFIHWQIVCAFKKKTRLGGVRATFGNVHAEHTRSEAALEYVWKEDTRVQGTQFELGMIPMKRNCKTDWERVKALAKEGKLEEIDANVYICHYRSLKTIAYDNLRPAPMVRTVNVYWGNTGVGKSRRAWEEAGFDAYPKDPRTKFWDGYRSHKHVVIDEFRGDIDIAHLLRWFDRYPVNVEIKGSAVVLCATHIWITSNLSPDAWFPTCDEATLNALKRRLNIVHMLDNRLT